MSFPNCWGTRLHRARRLCGRSRALQPYLAMATAVGATHRSARPFRWFFFVRAWLRPMTRGHINSSACLRWASSESFAVAASSSSAWPHRCAWVVRNCLPVVSTYCQVRHHIAVSDGTLTVNAHLANLTQQTRAVSTEQTKREREGHRRCSVGNLHFLDDVPQVEIDGMRRDPKDFCRLF